MCKLVLCQCKKYGFRFHFDKLNVRSGTIPELVEGPIPPLCFVLTRYGCFWRFKGNALSSQAGIMRSRPESSAFAGYFLR
jgi:hypothetical protein